MRAEEIASRLKKARKTSRSTWSACCPAHADKSPSLAIREADDGRILLRCFAGCEVASVIAAMGLDMSDLFPEVIDPSYRGHERKPNRVPFPARDVLKTLLNESSVLLVMARDLANGKSLNKEDHERLMHAAAKINEACMVANVC